MFMRVAIVLMVIVAVILLTPLILSAVKKTKRHYEEWGTEDASDVPDDGPMCECSHSKHLHVKGVGQCGCFASDLVMCGCMQFVERNARPKRLDEEHYDDET